ARQPATAPAALHRKKLRAMWVVRKNLPRRRHPAGAAPAAVRTPQRSRGAQRNPALPLCALRQGVRHTEGHRHHAAAAGRPRHVPGGGARTPEDVRRLPCHRPVFLARRNSHHRPMTATVPLAAIGPTGLDEDAARAAIYGLLAHLFYAPPSAELLAQLQEQAAASGSLLEASWNALADSARELDAATIASEYDALFGGVGKPEVYLFGSHYLAGFLNEKPLVRLRDDLSALGLARDPAMP